MTSRAVSLPELLEAYELVHDAFVEEGLLDAHDSRLRIRPWELTPELATFVAKSAGRVVGVMSVVGDSRELGLPSDHVFRAELDALRGHGRKVAEITNLAVAREFRASSVFLELARAVLAWCLDHGYDDGFAAVSPKHGSCFEHVLRFQPWGERRSYRLDANDPVEGFRLDLHASERGLIELDRALGEQGPFHDWFFRSNPFLGGSLRASEDARAAFYRDDVAAKLRAREREPASGWRLRAGRESP